MALGMFEAWRHQAKLAPSEPPAFSFARKALLTDERLPPVVLLAAGPGYGKSTLAWQLASREPTATLVWLTADPYDTDDASFFAALTVGVRQHIPDFGRELEPLIQAGNLPTRLLARRFFEAIAAYNLPAFHLVLDDLHHLQDANPALVEALVGSFEALPPGTRLFITTRRRLDLPLARLIARGRVLEWGAEQLRFSAEEAEGLLSQHAPAKLQEPVWQDQLARLEGWPLGVTWLLGAQTPLKTWRVEGPDSVTSLASYVAEEFFLGQPEARRVLLLQASLLHEVSVTALSEVFDASDAEEQVRQLAGAMLLRSQGEGRYRLPAYLKAYLGDLCETSVLPATRKAWHGRAARWYEAQDQPELALNHRIAAQQWPQALQDAQRAIPGLLLYGRNQAVATLLAQFPADTQASSPWLRLWQGHLALRRGQQGEAAHHYEQAALGFQGSGDPGGAFKVALRRCVLDLFTGEQTSFAQRLDQLESLREAARPEDRADLEVVRSVAAEHRGDLVLMQACSEAALAVPVEANGEVAACHATALMNLYTVAWLRGDLRAARRHAERALDISQQWQMPGYRLYLAFLLASLELVEGRVDDAERRLRALPATWPDVLDFQERGIAQTVIGHWHAARGAWREAEQALHTALDIFAEAGHAEGRKIPLERLLWLWVARHQPARVKHLAAQTGPSELRSLHDLALLLPQARASLELEDVAGAQALLDGLLPALEAHGAQLLLARAQRLQALVAAAAGDVVAAREAARQSQAIAEREGYDFLAAEDPWLAERFNSWVGRWSEAGEAPAGDVLTPPTACSHAVRCLGAFEFLRDGVALDHALRKKTKLVLAALVLHPRGLTVSSLAEVLGLQSVTPGNLKTLQADVVAIRRALEPELASGKASRYLRFEEDRYVLDWTLLGESDLMRVERELSRAEAQMLTDPAAARAGIERALADVRGNVLPEGFYASYFEPVRDGLRRRVSRACSWLARLQCERGEFKRADDTLRQALALAPCDEEHYLAMMEVQRQLGRPERVRQVYWDCRKALKSEWGVSPSEAFERAYRDLAAQLR
ncbi:MAG: BTAD domain-containing putative transcriptional regulator [Candidatus Sericytochromatia bacterium]|nr:BTAD domain-containing putative transcriptional regulator [Candidatus Sericytochromatia bacterium]